MEQRPVFRGAIAVSSGHLPPAERPIWPGTIGPVGSSPARQPGSVRRTSSVDIIWPDGLGRLILRGCARDIATGRSESRAQVIDEARLDVELGGMMADITEAAMEPDPFEISGWLVGQSPHFRLRGHVGRAHPELVASGSVGALLVDEIPGAALISGAALGRANLLPERASGKGPAIGVCAGWIEGGSMHLGLTGRPFLGEGPPAPSLTRPGDPQAWHDEPVLSPMSMRRRRRIDVIPPITPDAPVVVDVYFRDSYIEVDGTESVVHEYGILAEVDPVTSTVRSIRATAHVLPGPECPAAIASAQRLVGMGLADVRDHVRDEFRGTSTCTHLNDALRSIGDVGALMRSLPSVT